MKTNRLHPLIPAFLALAAACGGEAKGPAELDTLHDTCAFCRMPVSDPHLAAQLLVPSEIPKFYDDLGCLAKDLKGRQLPRGAAIYVADHRTGTWIPARTACYTRVPGLETPMGSHLVAHADPASRDADPDARGGTPVASASLWRLPR